MSAGMVGRNLDWRAAVCWGIALRRGGRKLGAGIASVPRPHKPAPFAGARAQLATQRSRVGTGAGHLLRGRSARGEGARWGWLRGRGGGHHGMQCGVLEEGAHSDHGGL